MSSRLGTFALVAFVLSSILVVPRAHAGAAQLQWVWGGGGGTVVFIHGKADCSTSMTDCNSFDATTGPVGYWTNSANNYDMLWEATTKYGWNGSSQTTTYYEAWVIG